MSDQRDQIVVRVRKLSKSYDGLSNVLDNISFDVGKGETFVVIGPSGAGKTTLLRLIDLLEYPTSGRLNFSGQDTTQLDNYDRLKLRRRIGMVFQTTILFSTNVYSNVAYGLRLRDRSEDDEPKSVSRALKTVGLQNLEERYAKTLSGGEAQRVAIARILAYGPELLLLDEPTQHLDIGRQLEMVDLIRSLSRRGIAILATMHDLTLIDGAFSSVWLLSPGDTMRKGTLEDMLQPELLERAFKYPPRYRSMLEDRIRGRKERVL